MNDVDVYARVLGRSDDQRFWVLVQEGPGGTVFRWPASRMHKDADGEAARVRIRSGSTAQPSTFESIRAGSYVFFRSAALELVLFFPLLPSVPPVVELTLETFQAEEREGLDSDVVALKEVIS